MENKTETKPSNKKKIIKIIIIIVALIALGIFILGVQIGIHHGRELQKQDFYSICF